MKDLSRYLIVGLGGFAGANARYILGGWVQNRCGPGFPFGTLVVNLLGSFAIGLFATLALRLAWDEQWRLLISIGFIGAFTTFSTLEYETLRLIAEGQRWRAALANLGGSVATGFCAAYVGIVVARMLLRGRA